MPVAEGITQCKIYGLKINRKSNLTIPGGYLTGITGFLKAKKTPGHLGKQDLIFQKAPQVVAFGECSSKYTTNLVPSNLCANEGPKWRPFLNLRPQSQTQELKAGDPNFVM
jgi:hypothetical protein